MSNLTIPTRFQADYTWTIENFESYCQVGEDPIVQSPNFSVAKDTFEWFLQLHINVECDPIKTTLYLEIANRTEFDKRGPISGKLECALMNSEGRKVKANSEYFCIRQCYYCQIEKFPRNVDDLYKTKCIHKDQLRIYCQISYVCEYLPCNFYSLIYESDSLKEDLEKLLNDEEFSDVTVYIGDKKFPCHKNILATRCSVFKAMLTHDMKENRSNRIDIHDIDENVFQSVLRYIYTGKIEILETTVLELLHAADKYDLAILKTMCETELSKTLAVQNAVKVLSISKTYNLENLRLKATEFIQTNLKKIANTEAWNDLISQPDLMKTVLEAFAK